MIEFDGDAATNRLLRFLAVEGVTGREAKIGKELVAALREAGVPARSIRFDDAHKRIPLPTETGNLIVELSGRGELKNAGRLLFLTHMDTVPLCAGANRSCREGRSSTRPRPRSGAIIAPGARYSRRLRPSCCARRRTIHR